MQAIDIAGVNMLEKTKEGHKVTVCPEAEEAGRILKLTILVASVYTYIKFFSSPCPGESRMGNFPKN